jgi:hypothetical protein
MLLLAVYVINVGYGFEGSLKPLGDYQFVSGMFGGPRPAGKAYPAELGNRFAGTWIGSVPVPLPENYLRGIDRQRLDFERRLPTYLREEWRQGGWWHYYLYGLAIKEPLGTWLIATLALVGSIFFRRYSAPRRDELVILAPLLTILVLVSSQTGINYLRYALPMFPFAFIWMSKVTRAVEFGWGQKGARDGGRGASGESPHPGPLPKSEGRKLHRAVACVAGVALAWSFGSSLYYYPHSLSYFNELVGGPRNGHTHLLDSNADWGQDLLYLKRWYDQHREARPLGLACSCPLVDPKIAGIEYTKPPAGPNPDAPVPQNVEFSKTLGPIPGWYAISVNELHRRDHQYDYFLRLEPVAMAGYSIYIYHITLEEANRVRREVGLRELGERVKDEG